MHEPHAQASCTGLRQLPAGTVARVFLAPGRAGKPPPLRPSLQEGTAQPAVSIGTGRESPDRQSSSGLLINAPVASRCPALSPVPAGTPAQINHPRWPLRQASAHHLPLMLGRGPSQPCSPRQPGAPAQLLRVQNFPSMPHGWGGVGSGHRPVPSASSVPPQSPPKACPS